jgi:hypothetical protein
MRLQSKSSSSSSEETTNTADSDVAICRTTLIDLFFCADIDSYGRLVEEQERRAGIKPLSQHNLLLVATRKRPSHCLWSGCFYSEIAHNCSGPGARRPTREKTKPSELWKVGNCQVALDRVIKHQPLEVAVFWYKCNYPGGSPPSVSKKATVTSASFGTLVPKRACIDCVPPRYNPQSHKRSIQVESSSKSWRRLCRKLLP